MILTILVLQTDVVYNHSYTSLTLVVCEDRSYILQGFYQTVKEFYNLYFN